MSRCSSLDRRFSSSSGSSRTRTRLPSISGTESSSSIVLPRSNPVVEVVTLPLDEAYQRLGTGTSSSSPSNGSLEGRRRCRRFGCQGGQAPGRGRRETDRLAGGEPFELGQGRGGRPISV